MQLSDGMYLMTEPLTGAQWMVRLTTPGKVQVVSRDSPSEAGSRVLHCLNRGYTFTRLVPLPTAELRDDIQRLGRMAVDGDEYGEPLGPAWQRVKAWLESLESGDNVT